MIVMVRFDQRALGAVVVVVSGVRTRGHRHSNWRQRVIALHRSFGGTRFGVFVRRSLERDVRIQRLARVVGYFGDAPILRDHLA